MPVFRFIYIYIYDRYYDFKPDMTSVGGKNDIIRGGLAALACHPTKQVNKAVGVNNLHSLMTSSVVFVHESFSKKARSATF